MNCTEFKVVFEGNLETPGSLDAPAREHLASCPSCHSQWDIQQQLDATIEAWQAEAGIDALNMLSPPDVDALMKTLHRSAPSISLAESVLRELNVPLANRVEKFRDRVLRARRHPSLQSNRLGLNCRRSVAPHALRVLVESPCLFPQPVCFSR